VVTLDLRPYHALVCFESESRTFRTFRSTLEVRIHMVVERRNVRVLLLLADGTDGHRETPYVIGLLWKLVH
jgi:hypothetical protein